MYTVSIPMSFAQRTLSLAGIIGVLTAAFAAGLIYLLVTQPVSTAETSPTAKCRRSSGPSPACCTMRFAES